MDKRVVCPLDGRRFATAGHLAQHKRDAHGAASAPVRKARRVPAPKRRVTPVGPQNVIAQPQRVTGRGSDIAYMSGLDRLLHIESVKTLQPGSVFYSFTVVPSGFKRLAKAAAVFQKIVYEHLVFRIEPQMSSTTGGGYIAGFVNDPDDTVRTADQLTAVANSVTTKWWQSAAVDAKIPQRQYFTAHGVELREYSPGTFYIICDGAATQSGSLTVFAEWKVRMSGAIVEAPPQKTDVLLSDVWIRKDQAGLWVKTASGAWSGKAADVLGTSVKAGEAYRLPYPVSLVKPNDSVQALHHYIYVETDAVVRLAVDYPMDYYTAAYTHDNVVVLAGTALEKWVANSNKLQGEVLGPSSLGSETMTNGLNDLLVALGQLPKLLAKLGTRSPLLSELQPESRERRLSVGSSSSMEFLHG